MTKRHWHIIQLALSAFDTQDLPESWPAEDGPPPTENEICNIIVELDPHGKFDDDQVAEPSEFVIRDDALYNADNELLGEWLDDGFVPSRLLLEAYGDVYQRFVDQFVQKVQHVPKRHKPDVQGSSESN